LALTGFAVRRLVAVVRGRVQGVGFRAATREVGCRLGLRGWVRNRFDDTVEVAAEGDDPALERLQAFLKMGPSLARVTNVDVFWEPATGELGAFEIK